MTPDRFQQVGRLYDQALELAATARAAFLAEACAGDDELRQEVESLLAAHENVGDFIAQPAVHLAADLFSTQTAELIKGRRIGNFYVLARIGQGGMGEVFLAQDSRLGRKVALKLLPKKFAQDPMRVKLFEREARAASALNHPNIITIFDIGRHEDTPFIATEYIEGQTVRQRLQTSPLPVRDAVAIARQTAAALVAAHEVGIIHRDIKPENVMVRHDGYVKVLDFGLAKLTEPAPATRANQEAVTRQITYTQPGIVVGTVSYMSPEQARGESLDGRSDVFSLGVLLYEMITGERPFQGETALEVLAAMLEREPAPLTASRPDIPAQLDPIVARALHKARESRYPSMRALLADLESLDRKLALGSGSHARAGRVKKKIMLWAAIAALLLLVGGAAAILRSSSPRPSITSDQVPASERTLIYHILARKDPKRFPDSAPFRLTREMIFEAWYQVRLLISSPQDGYLYVLEESPASDPQGAESFRRPGANVMRVWRVHRTRRNVSDYLILFPDADTEHWSAAISANREVQIPPSDDNWFVFDQEKGTEKLWLIWSERSVPELEAVKQLANPKDLGIIRNPDQIVALSQFLAHHSARPPQIATDEERKQTLVKTRGEVLVALIRLEHQ